MISIVTAKATADLEKHAITAIFAGYAAAPPRIDVANTVIHRQHILTLI